MRRTRCNHAKRRGATAVELAICVNVLFLFIFGIVEFSRLGMAAQLLTNAAREGGRIAAIQNSSLSDVQSRVNAMLSPAGISVGNLTAVDTDPGTTGAFIMPSSWSNATGDAPITVTIRVSYKKISWLPSPFFLSSANVVGTATLNSERP